MLVTFDVPVRADAAEMAVDTAVESGQPLILVNFVELTIRPMTASWGAEVVVMEDVDESLRAPAELAHSLAVSVERLRIVTPRRVEALLELVGERMPGLLVSGPTRAHARSHILEDAREDPRASSMPRLDSGGLTWYRACRPVRNTVGEEAIGVRSEAAPYVVVGAGIHGLSTAYHLAKELAHAAPARAPTSSSSTSRSPEQAPRASPAASSATTTSSRP